MDIGTVIGMVLAFGLMIAAILMDGTIGAFINGPGLMVVVGCTFASAFIAESMGNVFGTAKVASLAFFIKIPDPAKTIEKIAELALAARKDGILALEKMQVDEVFLAKGVRMAVDGVAPEEIKSTLNAEVISLSGRHKRAQDLFRFMGSNAPSMGMIGTLIGLVQMLQALDDPSAIGPAMAVALLTTLYGAIMAFMICNPIADKLKTRTGTEVLNMLIVMEGVDAILRGENPRLIQEKLEGYLAPKDRSAKE